MPCKLTPSGGGIDSIITPSGGDACYIKTPPGGEAGFITTPSGGNIGPIIMNLPTLGYCPLLRPRSISGPVGC